MNFIKCMNEYENPKNTCETTNSDGYIYIPPLSEPICSGYPKNIVSSGHDGDHKGT